MNIQYIPDSKGQTMGGFIPISEWNSLKNKYKGIEQEEVDISEWHKDMVRQRLEDYRKKPGSAMDFESTMDDIDKEL